MALQDAKRKPHRYEVNRKKKNLLNSLEGLTCDGGSDLLALFV